MNESSNSKSQNKYTDSNTTGGRAFLRFTQNSDRQQDECQRYQDGQAAHEIMRRTIHECAKEIRHMPPDPRSHQDRQHDEP